MSRDPVCSLLSLSAKGRNVVSGEFSVESALKAGKAYVVIIAEDASDNTKKKFTDMASFRNVPVYIYQDKETLGRSLGQQMRAMVALTDEGLGRAVIKKLEEAVQ